MRPFLGARLEAFGRRFNDRSLQLKAAGVLQTWYGACDRPTRQSRETLSML
jgi:hypothetical protein